MNILRTSNLVKLLPAFALICFIMGFTLSAQAQSVTKEQHLNKLMDRWISQNPVDAKALEKAKKDADKLEKDFKDYSDKAFQNSFDTVFKGKLKPSAAIDYLKVFEAVSSGDIEEAGKLTTDLAIAAYAPGLGHYIAAMKLFHGKVKKQITSWGNEVYKTDTFKFFRYDLAHMTKLDAMEARDLRYPVYIPSYMVNKFRADKFIGKEMDILYEEMVSFEGALYSQWSEGNEPRIFALQFGDLKKKSWWDFGSTGGKNSQWIVALGADPSSFGKLSVEKKMFNFFLYEMTASRREDYMFELSLFYIQPLIKKEARIEQKRLDNAIASAMNASIAAINLAVEQKENEAAKEQEKLKNRKAEIAKYRKYLDDGLANNTISLPLGMTPDAAFQIGMKAVDENKDYYKAIDKLNALALKQAEEREQAEQARQEQEDRENNSNFDMQEDIPVADETWLEEEEAVEGDFETDTSQPILQVDTTAPTAPSLVGNTRRQCLMTYDFSNHNQAGILALLPSNLQSDPSGENVKYMLSLIGEICKPGYTAPINDTDDDDDWDDVDEDLTVSYYTEEEKWAIRDEQAAKSETDAARSEDKFSRQYASIAAQRQEEARRAAEKARKRAEAFAAIAQGLGDMAAQIQEADRQNEAYSQQNLRSFDTSGLVQDAQKRSNFMKSCMSNRPSTPGFKSFDPNADRVSCGENYRARQSGTAGNGNTYDERLRKQQQETTRRRAEEQRRAVAERRTAQNLARERAQAKKECACYQGGKSSGRSFAKNEANKNTLMDTSSRPATCRAHIMMGDEAPWHDGFFDGKHGNSANAIRRDGKKWCRFGS